MRLGADVSSGLTTNTPVAFMILWNMFRDHEMPHFHMNVTLREACARAVEVG